MFMGFAASDGLAECAAGIGHHVGFVTNAKLRLGMKQTLGRGRP